MFVVPCVRVDVDDPEDHAGGEEVTRAVRALVEALHANPVARLNAAFTGHALRHLRAHGEDLLDDLRDLCAREQVELVTTPHDGALLPLLPRGELERQLLLDERALVPLLAGRPRRLGLWPTALAISMRVLHAAAHLGFVAVLVDAACIDDAAARDGRRLTASPAAPGVFLVPVGGPAGGPDDLSTMRVRVLAHECAPGAPPPIELLDAMARRRTLRIPDVLELFPKDGVTTLSPGMKAPGSTPAHPFGAWSARPEAAKAAATVAGLSAQLARLDAAGLSALPTVRTARALLDSALRAGRWLSARGLADLDRCAGTLALPPGPQGRFDVHAAAPVL